MNEIFFRFAAKRLSSEEGEFRAMMKEMMEGNTAETWDAVFHVIRGEYSR